jgi:two-component system heavy metal sensor histidine kinase CusS
MSSTKGRSRSWSLAARLTTWYTAASLILALFTMATLYVWLDAYLTQREDDVLSQKVRVLRSLLSADARPDAALELTHEVEMEPPAARRKDAQVYVRLIDERGRAVLATQGMDELLPRRLFPTDASPSDGMALEGSEIRTPRAGPFRALTARARRGTTGPTWTIQAARDRAHHELLLANFRRGLLMTLAIMVTTCPLVAFFIARRGLRPVHEISETARHIGSATLSARISSTGYPVELEALAETFNAMLDRLDDSFRRLSQFSADIAHELRTPIHNMRGEAEVVLSRARSADEYKEALTSCLEESVRLSELISKLLFLARAEGPATQLEREPVDVIRELAAVRDYYADAATDARVTLSVEAGDDVEVAADRGLLQDAITNLVANSLSHTPPGGSITLAAGRENGRVRIEVRDTGSGIPVHDLPRVFDRFYRADRSRSSQPGSMGLGLAIVKGIVRFHGGETEIESEVGKGTRVALLIPCGPQPVERFS